MATICNGRKKYLWLALVFTIFLILCLLFSFHFAPKLIKQEINKNVELKNGTKQFDRFVELPFPIDFQINIFNVENPNSILAGQKPILKEVGPFVFKETRKKTILESSLEDAVSYTQLLQFTFDAVASYNKSGLHLLDTHIFTVLNVPLLGMIQEAEVSFQAAGLALCLDSIFPKGFAKLFIEVDVKTLIFDGIQFCIKNQTAPDGMCNMIKEITCELAAQKRNIRKDSDGSLRFSYFDYKRNKTDGKYDVDNGNKAIEHLGEILLWNNSRYTTYWNKKEKTVCDKIRGSDSTVFPPQATTKSVFKIYSTDICSSLEINFIKTFTYEGIEGFEYGVSNETFRPRTVNPKGDCFCTINNEYGTKDIHGNSSCFLEGILDLYPCVEAPVLISNPHFLWAENFADGVYGLLPNVEQHRTFVVIEPNTGTPLTGAKKMQLNMVLRPTEGITMTSNLRGTVLPMLWVSEEFSLPSEFVKELKSEYFQKKTIFDIVRYGLITISTIFILGCTIMFLKSSVVD